MKDLKKLKNFGVLIYQLEVCQEGGYLEDIEGPDRRHGGHGHSYIMNDVFLPQGIYPENFMLISHLQVCQEGGSRRGYLEDVEGS